MTRAMAEPKTLHASTVERRPAIMIRVSSQPHVTLAGDIAGEYVVTDTRPDGTLTLAPASPLDTMLARSGARRLSTEEQTAFEREYGDELLPPDGEG
jgi:hypothetical protein